MAYRHVLNFWSVVPAMGIETTYKTLKTDPVHANDYDIPPNNCHDEHPSPPSSYIKDDMNILIIGDGTGCLIKTMAEMYRHESKNLNIYVVSNFTESLSRTLLLLSLFNESSKSMGKLEKAETFLEIFGNTCIRASTASYVETTSTKILEDIVSEKQAQQSSPRVSLKFLKHCEIDELCMVMTFLKSPACTYDVAKAWENALRAYFGTRYDNRKNMFDYQYNMKLSQYPIIGLKKYMEWCESGTAFKLRNGRYDQPNKTLYVQSIKSSVEFDPFYGDLATSPYITFGVECKNEKLFEKVNNQHTHTSEDISKFNIIDYMTEFSSNASQTDKKLNVYLFLVSTFRKTRKFQSFFDAIYLTCDMAHYAENGAIRNILREDGIAIFETVQNVVNSTKQQKTKHLEDIDRLARINNLKCAGNIKNDNGCFKTFLKNVNA